MDTKKGEYLPLGMVIEKYGILYDREKAIEAGMKYCTKACKMGGSWTFIDPMSEVIHVLHLKYDFIETMTEAWANFDKEYGDATIKKAGQGAKAKVQPGPAKQILGNETGEGPPKKTKSTLDALMASGNKVKGRLIIVRCTAEGLEKMIGQGIEGWAWAKHDDCLGKLTQGISDLKGVRTPEMESFLALDNKEMKAKYSGEQLTLMLQEFLKTTDKVDALDAVSKSLIRMRNAK